MEKVTQSKEYLELETAYEKVSEDLDKERNKELEKIRGTDNGNDFMKAWNEVNIKLKPMMDLCNTLSRNMRMIKIPTMENILSRHGDHMTIEDFIANVNCGGFIDYDGSGNYATADQESDITIYPSDIKRNKYRKDFTHVMWYNR